MKQDFISKVNGLYTQTLNSSEHLSSCLSCEQANYSAKKKKNIFLQIPDIFLLMSLSQ